MRGTCRIGSCPSFLRISGTCSSLSTIGVVRPRRPR
ncbi:MAG: hypothetical protein KC800_00895 [Candidatus Eremiobacteraeota bacterium]|nr:hypothetical protein [Candidatus Eremiobacteraeota bacterium]